MRLTAGVILLILGALRCEAAPDALYGICGPVPAPALPPFAVTTALSLAAVGAGALIRRKGKGADREVAAGEPVPPCEQLALLRQRYEANQITASELFDEIAPLLFASLPAGSTAITSDEAMAAARQRFPEPAVTRLGAVLKACDAVRYGRLAMPKEQVLTLLDDAASAMRWEAET